MIIKKANKKETSEAINVSQGLTKWFDKRGLKDIKTDLKLNNLIVAVDKRKVIGFLCYSTYSGRMQLVWIGVKLNAQRKRIGEKLLKWLEKEAKRYRLYSIEVETLTDKDDYEPYKRTRSFYYKNGFKKAYYKKPRIKGWDNIMILEKKLK